MRPASRASAIVSPVWVVAWAAVWCLSVGLGCGGSKSAVLEQAGADPWTRLNGPDGGTVFALAIHPTTSATLYAGTETGPYKTTDSGATWTEASTGLPVTRIQALAVDPATPSTVYAGTFGRGVYKTTNAGAAWAEASSGLPQAATITALAVDPQTSTTLYAAMPTRLFKSINGGQTWTEAATGLPSGAGIQALLATSTTLYAGTDRGVYKTSDGATTWTAAATGLGSLSIQTLAVHPLLPATLYAGTVGTSGGTIASIEVTPSSAYAVPSTSGDPKSQQFVAVARDAFGNQISGVNLTWTTSDTTRATVSGTGLARTVGAGSAPVVITASTGLVSGAALLSIPDVATGGTLASLVVTPTTARIPVGSIQPFAATALDSLGLIKTSVAMTWTSSDTQVALISWSSSSSSGAVATAVGVGQTLISVGSGSISRSVTLTVTAAGVFKSTTAAAAWTATTGLPSSLSVSALVVDPQGILYAGTLGMAVSKSTDGGATWTAAGTGLVSSESITVLVIDSVDRNTLYAATSRGVYKTTTAGANWAVAGTGLPSATAVRVMTGPTQTPTTLYAGTASRGVFKTTDGGTNWTAASTGLESALAITALTVDPLAPATLYAGTLSGGVFKTTDGGGSWVKPSPAFTTALGGQAVFALAVDPLVSSIVYAGTAAQTTFVAFVGQASSVQIGPTTLRLPVSTTQRIPIAAIVRDQAGNPMNQSNLTWTSDATDVVTTGTGYIIAASAGTARVTASSGGVVSNAITVTVVAAATTGPFTNIEIFPTTATVLTGGTQFFVAMLRSADQTVLTSTVTWTTNPGLGSITGTRLESVGAAPGAVTVTAASGGLLASAVLTVLSYPPGGGGAVFKTTDGGATWGAAGTGLVSVPVRAIAIDPQLTSIVYAATDSGVYKTTNGGATWAQSSSVSATDLVVHPVTPTTVYAVTSQGVLKTTDRGATWTAANSGLLSSPLAAGGFSPPAVLALTLNPLVPSTLYAATGSQTASGLFRSQDGGGSWSSHATGLPTNVFATALFTASDGKTYAGTTRWVYRLD